MESIVEERPEDAELINQPDNTLTLQDALECVKQHAKHLQNEKKNKKTIIKIAYNQGYILHKLKESDEFIDSLVKRLKMSKNTITFKIKLYKLLKKFPLLKHSDRSMPYFTNFFRQIKLICQISGHQFKNILIE